jgi:hypothetical protein
MQAVSPCLFCRQIISLGWLYLNSTFIAFFVQFMFKELGPSCLTSLAELSELSEFCQLGTVG